MADEQSCKTTAPLNFRGGFLVRLHLQPARRCSRYLFFYPQATETAPKSTPRPLPCNFTSWRVKAILWPFSCGIAILKSLSHNLLSYPQKPKRFPALNSFLVICSKCLRMIFSSFKISTRISFTACALLSALLAFLPALPHR